MIQWLKYVTGGRRCLNERQFYESFLEDVLVQTQGEHTNNARADQLIRRCELFVNALELQTVDYSAA